MLPASCQQLQYWNLSCICQAQVAVYLQMITGVRVQTYQDALYQVHAPELHADSTTC